MLFEGVEIKISQLFLAHRNHGKGFQKDLKPKRTLLDSVLVYAAPSVMSSLPFQGSGKCVKER